MADSSAPRRQTPSPLIFSPESVLAPLSTQAVAPQRHGSGSNTVTMPFIKRHVTRRLKTAKQECDKDLQRVTNAITTFFEERLRDGEGDRDESDIEATREGVPFNNYADNNRSALHSDDHNFDGGYDAEFDSSRHSRQASLSSSPASLRRQSTLPKEKSIVSSNSSTSALSPSEASPRRGLVEKPSQTTFQARASRRLSRTIHIPMRASRSGQSSRSTSRSRSPLPGTTQNSFSEHAVSTSPNRRSSRILVDDPVDPIMTTLYDIISVCTDITEMTIAQITSQPKVCAQWVQRVQQIGKVWDDHPDWHGRNWYVQVLLAVASLSRVVEWWEAEKQFWNFDDEDDEDAGEPFTFLLKPSEEVAPTPRNSLEHPVDDGKPVTITSEDEMRLRLNRSLPPAHPRDDVQKVPAQQKEEEHSQPPAVHSTDSARVLATERLRLQAEQAQNQNIVLELSLDGDTIVWVNHAWESVVGSNPDDMNDQKVSARLAPVDWSVFKDATQQLLSDDSHTIEIRFRLRVDVDADPSRGILYRDMEAKGMLMLDSINGAPTHTMWVMKAVGPPAYDQSQGETEEIGGNAQEGDGDSGKSSEEQGDDNAPAFPLPISTALILCRICENNIPEWFFEKHNETCNDVHKFEADIMECNESIAELRNTIRELRGAIDRSSPVSVPEYRGMPILSPVTNTNSSSALQLFRPPLMSKMQRMSVKRMQRRLLEQLDDILQIAAEVSLPSLKEEEAKEPIERQRLLSPTSERKILQVRNWSKPSSEDPALSRLIGDTETLMRTKMDNVTRLQNTIRYSEKVRQEWQEKMEQQLALQAEEEESEEDSDGEEGDHDEAAVEDDHASTTSEYAFAGDTISEKTPAATSEPTPIPAVTPVTSSSNSSRSHSGSGSGSTGVRSPIPVPGGVYHQSQNMNLYTRSSTPSSITSPLALAAPIVASEDTDQSSPTSSCHDEKPANAAIIRRKSTQTLEPRVTLTPPISPHITPREGGALPKMRRLSTINPVPSSGGPLSPRIPPVVSSTRSLPTSIKDFEIIKPISKGAFGSVFLAKKKVTGDYYAIKVLKKADMIAKNQITNVKAERMILMNQADSPFVAKLYFTFQSKENLYLVMEYLNGGDCAALIKSLGCLPEEWTKNYIAEVVLGLEYLHSRGIVHRDLKPDNLLIDLHGHLKLTDFGLSRIGLLGRQAREVQLNMDRLRPIRTRYSPGSRPPSLDSVYLSSPLLSADAIGGSYFTQRIGTAPSLASSPHVSSGTPADDISESSGSDSLSGAIPRRSMKLNDSPLQSFASELTNDLRLFSAPGSGTPPAEQKFVGTPDYLAPESILGISGDDAVVDWWALGVITYEFLYGIPPFHAETPEKVFENILSGHVDWHEDFIDFSPEALDFMKRLLNLDTAKRLGANGAQEVKDHPFFQGIDWDKVTTSEAAFIPQVTDPESTDYFDLRGASTQLFHDDEAIPVGQSAATPGINTMGSSTVAPVPILGHLGNLDQTHGSGGSPSADDFGSFSFKNLPVLKQHNDDVIRKLKTDQMTPMHSLSEPATIGRSHRRSISQRARKPPSVVTSNDGSKLPDTNPPSPATSVSSIASSPSRASMQPSTPGSTTNHNHVRRPSEYGAVERFKQKELEGEISRRNSMPSRLRTASVSTCGEGSSSDHWPASVNHISGHFDASSPPSSNGSLDLRRGFDPNDRSLTCLLAEDNPITAKIIETLLIRLGCRVIVVSDGSEAISVAHGDIKFDCILMDLQMPVVDGESAARHIKSTTNKNSSVPIIAVSAYGGQESCSSSNLFASWLGKPVQKSDLVAVMRQLGFKTSTHIDGGASSTRVIATR